MEYKKVSSYESSGKYDVGVQILVAVNREIGKEETFDIRDKAEDIVKILMNNYAKQDQVNAESGRKETEDLVKCFSEPIYVEKIPNGYFNDWFAINRPWLVVTTKIGRIKIGWRKRVISIDWSDSVLKEKADVIFPNEDVTKDGCLIHAWGIDKAREYVAKIMKVGLAPWEDI